MRLLNDITDGGGGHGSASGGGDGGDGTARRGSTSARRSFFRRKKHPRSSSRDSKEVASFSNTQLSWFSDSGMLSEEGTMLSYQRVERLDCEFEDNVRLWIVLICLCRRFRLPTGANYRTAGRMRCRQAVD